METYFNDLRRKKEQWNPKTGRLPRLSKECAAINDNLDLIQRKAYEVFEEMKYSVSFFTLDEPATGSNLHGLSNKV